RAHPICMFASCLSNATATPESYTLSLHELFRSHIGFSRCHQWGKNRASLAERNDGYPTPVNLRKDISVIPMCKRFIIIPSQCQRSEEHTSELQSRENLVCRLLLEKKNAQQKNLN